LLTWSIVVSRMVRAASRVCSSCKGTHAVALAGRKLSDFLAPSGVVRTFWLALAFAGLLPSNPANAQQATATGSQTAAPAPSPSAVKRSATDYLATIIQSSSTNTRGYKLVIHKDGSAVAEINGTTMGLRVGQGQELGQARPQHFAAGTIDAKTLRRLLRKVGDVSKIPTGGCPKSVSFGTRTQVEYLRKTSGDLQCIRQPAADADQALLQASEDLGKFVQTTLSQLKVNDRRLGSNP